MKDEIRKYLLSNNATGRIEDFSDEDSLLEAGVIDSMTMVGLIAFLEETYGISIGEDDMIPENFDSIDAIATYIEARRDAA